MTVKIQIVNIPNYGNIAITKDFYLSELDTIVYDINNHKLRSYEVYSELPKNYLDLFIYSIIGGVSNEGKDEDLPIISLLKSFIGKDKLYSDLSNYSNNTELELPYVDDRLVFDTELTESINKLQNIIDDSTINTKDQLIEAIKSNFNLTEVKDESSESNQVSELGKSPSSIVPETLVDFSNIAQSYLTNESYVKGNSVVFEVNTPYSKFIEVREDNSTLLDDIVNYYKSGGWLRISAEEVTAHEIKVNELIPFVDNKIYIKVGDSYQRYVPTDIKVKLNSGELVDLFGGNIYLIVNAAQEFEGQSITEVEAYQLTDKLGYLGPNGNLEQIKLHNGHKLVTIMDGVETEIDGSIYYKLGNSTQDYMEVNGLNKSLFMASTTSVTSSKTRFKFEFK